MTQTDYYFIINRVSNKGNQNLRVKKVKSA